jgi:recombination protein RecT
MIQRDGFDPKRELWADRKKIEALLPDHMDFNRFAAMAVRAFADAGPSLRECTPESFLDSVMKAAKYGLELDGILGEAYLVPFKERDGQNQVVICTLIPGYKGLLKLGHQSDKIKTIMPAVVYEADKFRYELGMHVDVKHLPRACREDEIADDQITYMYVIFELTNGGKLPFVWPVAEIKHHRDRYSKSYRSAEKLNKKDSTWHTAFKKMGLKTVLRDAMGSGLLPISTEIREMIQKEKMVESDNEGGLIIDGEMSNLADELTQKRIANTPEAPDYSKQADENRQRQEPVNREVTRTEPKRQARTADQPKQEREPAPERQQSVATQTQDDAQESDIMQDYMDQIEQLDSQEELQVVSLSVKRSKQLDDEQKQLLRRRLDAKNQQIMYGS